MSNPLTILRRAAEGLPLCRSPREVLLQVEEAAVQLTGEGRSQVCSPGRAHRQQSYPIVGHAVIDVAGHASPEEQDALLLLASLGREALQQLGLRKELDNVRSLKQEMLPDPSLVLGDYEVSAWLLPAGQTGGDIYDYWKLSPHRLGFFLADATGHGLGPAVVISHCRGLLRGMTSANTMPDLPDLTRRLSRLLCQDTPVDRFVTACLGLIDTQTNMVKLVCAGHGGLVFIQRNDQITDNWPTADPPLGVDLTTRYQQHSLPLAAGERLAIVTDGFVEALNPQGDAFGPAGVRRALLETVGQSPRSCIRRLYEELVVFVRSDEQADDLAVLVVERKEHSSETPS